MQLIVVLLKMALFFFAYNCLNHREMQKKFVEKFSRTFKSTTNRRTFNRRTVEVQAQSTRPNHRQVFHLKKGSLLRK